MPNSRENRERRGPAFGLVVGVGLGILVALVFKKLAWGILLGLLVTALLYRASRE